MQSGLFNSKEGSEALTKEVRQGFGRTLLILVPKVAELSGCGAPHMNLHQHTHRDGRERKCLPSPLGALLTLTYEHNFLNYLAAPR